MGGFEVWGEGDREERWEGGTAGRRDGGREGWREGEMEGERDGGMEERGDGYLYSQMPTHRSLMYIEFLPNIFEHFFLQITISYSILHDHPFLLL
jgi:hypothetical protein